MKNKKTISSSIIELIAKDLNLDFDNNETDFRLFAETIFIKKMTKAKYKLMEKDLLKKCIKNKSYQIYAWNDSSGFEYWNRYENDTNYIQVTIYIKDLNLIDLKKLKDEVIEFVDYFNNKYSRSL